MKGLAKTLRGADRTLLKLFDQVEKRFREAARDPQDPAAIHGLRTASRRLAQALVLFEAGNRRMRRRLRKLIAATGSVRNLDVIFEVLKAARAGATKALRESLEQVRKEAQRKLARKLRRWSARDCFSGWKQVLSPSSDVPALQESVIRLMEDFFDHGDRAAQPGRSYESIHRFRVLSKQLRYTLELTEPRGSAKLQTLKGVQDLLGGLNDCVVAADIVSEVDAATPVVTRKVRNLIPKRELAFRVYWRKTFTAAERTHWLKEYR